MSQRSLAMHIVTLLLLCLTGTFAWAAAPTITAIVPPSGLVGTVITVTGTDLGAAIVVTLNGVPIKTITDNTATALKVTVPKDATSGKLVVTTAGGTATSEDSFFVLFGLKTNANDNAAMVWVPGGTFTMGSADGVGNNNERPAHQVTLTGYWIYKDNVTVAQYRAFCAATTRALPQFPDGKSWEGKTGWDDPALQQHPIVNVSWNDAQAYAGWAGVRLPSEAQWEYAARGPLGRNYPWGGTAAKDDEKNGWDATKCANSNNSWDKGISTWPVGSFPAGTSWCGAQDMAGNARQWCSDWNSAYAAAAVTDPIGPAKGTRRVLRGDSEYNDYYSNNSYRSAGRTNYSPDFCGDDLGFRCVSFIGGIVPTFSTAPPVILPGVAPTITAISPFNAIVGTVITITGTDLDAALVVTLNGIPIKTITDNTTTSLKVTVPKDATSGKLAVTTAGGTGTSVDTFTVLFGLKTNANDNAAMLWVPGATFTMGDDRSAHQVTLSGYWIYQYDVTVAQYRAFCAATTHPLPEFPSGYSWKGKAGWSDPALQQHPIVNVSWNDAKDYAGWAGVKLPTEAQWEYAARGQEGRNYPWGGTATIDDMINGWDATKCAHSENSSKVDKSTWPVGSFPAGISWCGALDMAGNVAQWCSDWYGRYGNAIVTDPTGPAEGQSRVLRGGSWYYYYGGHYSDGGRSAYRGYNGPDGYGGIIGFRCCSLSPGP